MLIFFNKHYGHLSIFFSLPVKIAIYSRAIVAFVQMMTKRFHHFLYPRS